VFQVPFYEGSGQEDLFTKITPDQTSAWTHHEVVFFGKGFHVWPDVFPTYICALKNGKHFREFLFGSFRYANIALNNAKQEPISDRRYDSLFVKGSMKVKGTLKLVTQELMYVELGSCSS